jgi:hypothetical protein
MLQLNADLEVAWGQGDRRSFKAGCAHQDLGIVGKAKAFLGNAHETAIEDAVAVGTLSKIVQSADGFLIQQRQ